MIKGKLAQWAELARVGKDWVKSDINRRLTHRRVINTMLKDFSENVVGLRTMSTQRKVLREFLKKNDTGGALKYVEEQRRKVREQGGNI